MASKMSKAPAKKVNVAGQEHSLAYINKSEARMLRRMGGSGKPGPSGIPTYIPDDGNRGGGDFSDAPSGPSGGEYGGGDATDLSNYSLQNYKDNQRNQTQNSAAQQRANRISKAKKQLQDRINNKNVTGILSYTPSGAAINFGNKAMRSYMMNQLDDKGLVDAIFDSKGNYAGNVTKGLFGFNVYTGKQIAGYTGAYADIVAAPDPDADKDDRIQDRVVRDYGGGKISEDKKDGVNLPDAPDTPGDVGDGDQTEEAKKKSSLGQESTIGTSAQGLLSDAKTRRRSLMSGLIR